MDCDGGGVTEMSPTDSRFRFAALTFGISGLDVTVLFLGRPRRPEPRWLWSTSEEDAGTGVLGASGLIWCAIRTALGFSAGVSDLCEMTDCERLCAIADGVLLGGLPLLGRTSCLAVGVSSART